MGVREWLPYLRLSDGAFGVDVNVMHARVVNYEQQRPELAQCGPTALRSSFPLHFPGFKSAHFKWLYGSYPRSGLGSFRPIERKGVGSSIA